MNNYISRIKRSLIISSMLSRFLFSHIAHKTGNLKRIILTFKNYVMFKLFSQTFEGCNRWALPIGAML